MQASLWARSRAVPVPTSGHKRRRYSTVSRRYCALTRALGAATCGSRTVMDERPAGAGVRRDAGLCGRPRACLYLAPQGDWAVSVSERPQVTSLTGGVVAAASHCLDR